MRIQAMLFSYSIGGERRRAAMRIQAMLFSYSIGGGERRKAAMRIQAMLFSYSIGGGGGEEESRYEDPGNVVLLQYGGGGV